MDDASHHEPAWGHGASDPPEHPAPVSDIDAEIVVIGGGIAGVSTAWALRRAGHSVAVLEARRLGSGITGRSTGKPMRVHGLHATSIADTFHGRDHAESYIHANRAAQSAMQDWIGQEGLDCDSRLVEHLLYATSESGDEDLRKEHELQVACGERCELRAPRDGDGLPAAATSVLAVADELLLDPVRFVRALAGALAGEGGQVHEQARVVDLDVGRERVELTLEGGATARCDRVVVATHVPAFDPSLLFAAAEYRGSSCLAFNVPDGMVVPTSTPVDRGGTSMRPALSAAGTPLAVVAGGGRPIAQHTDEGERRAQVQERVRALYPELGALHAAWDAMDAFPADKRPFAGQVDHKGRVWTASGFSGWGLTGSVAAALTIAALVTREHSPWSDSYNPRRRSVWLRPALAKGGSETAKAWLGDRIAARRGADDEDAPTHVAPGEGAVVQGDDGPVAVHRDASGNLHAVSATCTHAGCLVRFDAQDGAWECPCHGSRFAIDGSVLDGPAKEPLAPADPREALD